MKRSTFTDEQILAIVKDGEAGRKVVDLSRTYGITEQSTTLPTAFVAGGNRKSYGSSRHSY